MLIFWLILLFCSTVSILVIYWITQKELQIVRTQSFDLWREIGFSEWKHNQIIEQKTYKSIASKKYYQKNKETIKQRRLNKNKTS